jgi:hypothetical protein
MVEWNDRPEGTKGPIEGVQVLSPETIEPLCGSDWERRRAGMRGLDDATRDFVRLLEQEQMRELAVEETNHVERD